MTDLAQHPAVQALAWALVHFLWQGAALGLLAFASLRLARTSPTVRYAIGVVTLAAMCATPVATWAYLMHRADTPRAVADTTPGASRVANGPLFSGPLAPAGTAQGIGSDRVGAGGPRVVAALMAMWLVGVGLLSVRLVGGWVLTRRFARRSVHPVTAEVTALVHRIAGRLALDRVVRVVESSAVSVPMLIGWMSPLVLLPAAALTGLTPFQLEALLAHELAHVRRHDYLINMLQAVVEVLLFYHPAVWWMSRQVREAREHCCDDLAIGVCGDRLLYVTALTDLAMLSTPPRFAMAATDGSLLGRVRRILAYPSDTRRVSTAWWPVLFIVLVTGALIPAAAAHQPDAATPLAPTALAVAAVPSARMEVAAARDTTVARRSAPTLTRSAVQVPKAEHSPETASQDRLRKEERQKEFRAAYHAPQILIPDQRAADRKRAQEAEAEAQQARLQQMRLNRITDIDRQLGNVEAQLAELLKTVAADHPTVDDLMRRRVRDLLERRQSLQAMQSMMLKADAAAKEVAEAAPESDQAKFLRSTTDTLRVLAEWSRETQPISASDRLHVNIPELRALAGDYAINSDGGIQLPLIGLVKVVGSTLQQAESLVRNALTNGGVGPVSVAITRVGR